MYLVLAWLGMALLVVLILWILLRMRSASYRERLALRGAAVSRS